MRNRPFDQEIAIIVVGSDNAHWQWSCTENPDNPSNVYDVDFTDGDDDWDHKDNNRLSARPVCLAELDAPFSILFLIFITFCI